MEKNEIELQRDHELIVSPLESDKLISIAESAERRAEAIKKIKRQALRITNESDWVDQGGKPYIQASGAEKIARLFGISWRFIGEPQRFDEENGHFRFDVSMEFIMGNSSVEVRGSRSSKDTFFTTRYRWDEKAKERLKIELPPSEIDKADVMKSAITNAIGNGISRILGIRNLTWEDLREVGLDPSKISKVEYPSSLKGKEKKPSPENQPEKDTGEPSTEAQVKAIGKMLDRLGIKDEYQRHEKISQILALDSVLPSMSNLTKKQASNVIEALQQEGAK